MPVLMVIGIHTAEKGTEAAETIFRREGLLIKLHYFSDEDFLD